MRAKSVGLKMECVQDDLPALPLIYQQVLPGFEKAMQYTVNRPPTLIKVGDGG